MSGARIAALLSRLEGELRTLRDGDKYSQKSRISAGNLLFVCTAPAIAARYTSVVDEMARRFPSRAFFVVVDGTAPAPAPESTPVDLDAAPTAQIAGDDEEPRSMMGLELAPARGRSVAPGASISPDGEPRIEGRVYAVETDADGLSDRVDLRGPREFARHLASAVDALVLPELPVILVWVGAARADDGVFQAFNDDARRVITDSAYAGLDTLLSLFAWTQGAVDRPRLSDLAWVRLGPWQELTARFFDDDRRPLADHIERVEVVHAAADRNFEAPDCSLYTAWIGCQLGWQLERDPAQPGVSEPVPKDALPDPAGKVRPGLCATLTNGRQIPITVREIPRPKGVAPGTLASVRFVGMNGDFTAEIARDLATGQGDQTVDADLLHWRFTQGTVRLEQTIRLHSNKVSYWIDRTVRRPDEEPLFVAVCETLIAMQRAELSAPRRSER